MKNTLFIVVLFFIIIMVLANTPFYEDFDQSQKTEMLFHPKPTADLTVPNTEFNPHKGFGKPYQHNDPNHYDVLYHNSYKTEAQTKVLDSNGRLIPIPRIQPTYYEPGAYKFGSATWVPNYTESVYLATFHTTYHG